MRNFMKNFMRTGKNMVKKLKPTSILLLDKLDKHGKKLMSMLHKTLLSMLRNSDKIPDNLLIALVLLLLLLETPLMVRLDNNTELIDKLTELTSST